MNAQPDTAAGEGEATRASGLHESRLQVFSLAARIVDQHLLLLQKRDLREMAVGIVRKHHVVGGDVAMQQAAAMNVLEAGQHLRRDVGSETERQRAMKTAPLPQRGAVDELRDHVAATVAEKEVVYDGDVRMVHLRRELRLAKKARAIDLVIEQRLTQHLDAAERIEVRMTRFEDLPHPARPEEGEYFVLAIEHRPRTERGRSGTSTTSAHRRSFPQVS